MTSYFLFRANGSFEKMIVGKEADAAGAVSVGGGYTTEAPPSERAIWFEDEWQDVITTGMVNAERDRRIVLPKTITLSTGNSFPVDIDNDGRANLAALATEAGIRMRDGLAAPFVFRDANNVDQILSSSEMEEVGRLALAQVMDIHAAAKVLKAMSPIPADYDDAQHWPEV